VGAQSGARAFLEALGKITAAKIKQAAAPARQAAEAKAHARD
jgi:hypothetical protein